MCSVAAVNPAYAYVSISKRKSLPAPQRPLVGYARFGELVTAIVLFLFFKK